MSTSKSKVLPDTGLTARMDRIGWTESPTGCWIWNGSFTPEGYAKISVGGRAGRTLSVHRIAHERWVGEIPPGQVVRHTCDVRACINPAHLLSGSQADNMRDMADRGRGVYGEAHPGHSLTEQDVRDIVAASGGGESIRSIARRYRVANATIWRLLNGKSWRRSTASLVLAAGVVAAGTSAADATSSTSPTELAATGIDGSAAFLITLLVALVGVIAVGVSRKGGAR